MDYTKGYKASFYAAIFDPVTWTDNVAIEDSHIRIINGSINRSFDGIRHSANLTIKNYDNALDRWIRIYAEVEQGGDVARIPVFTGIATSPSESYTWNTTQTSLQCYSGLQLINCISLQHGWYARKNANGIRLIKDLLTPISQSINEHIEVTTDAPASLEDYIVAEDQETNLSMIEKILTSMDWMMQIRGDGTIVLSPKPDLSGENPTSPVDILSPEYSNIIESNFSISHDWFEVPNILEVTYNEMVAIAKDEDPDSPLSIQNRSGREIWAVESSPALADDETLPEYTRKRLKELQELSESVSYARRFMPDINVGDVIRIGYPQISGDFVVESQNIDLTHGLRTDESVVRSA